MSHYVCIWNGEGLLFRWEVVERCRMLVTCTPSELEAQRDSRETMDNDGCKRVCGRAHLTRRRVWLACAGRSRRRSAGARKGRRQNHVTIPWLINASTTRSGRHRRLLLQINIIGRCHQSDESYTSMIAGRTIALSIINPKNPLTNTMQASGGYLREPRTCGMHTASYMMMHDSSSCSAPWRLLMVAF
jgi:hypothetical protein